MYSQFLPFLMTGANKDYVVIGSDSGTISIVEYDNTGNCWKVVHCEVFGRTGCRRAIPGEYLAADPKGRAIMICKWFTPNLCFSECPYF
jgi:splicing factor 3B subunit 3